jgi:hypothetical protein
MPMPPPYAEFTATEQPDRMRKGCHTRLLLWVRIGSSLGVPATSGVRGESDISDGMSEVGGTSDVNRTCLLGPILAIPGHSQLSTTWLIEPSMSERGQEFPYTGRVNYVWTWG